MQVVELLEGAVDLSESKKPQDCSTAAYLFLTLRHIPSTEEALMNLLELSKLEHLQAHSVLTCF